MQSQSENSRLIVKAQMTDSDISIVRDWLLSEKFPACIQDFAPASYELKAYWIGRKSLFLDSENILWRNRSAKQLRAQLAVPRSLRDTIFNDSHHTTYGGHFGMTHTHRTLLAMLAMFVSREHDNWDDLLPFMMLAYNTTVHTTTGFTPYRLVFGEECNLPGNLVHRELRPDPPPGDPGTYASWVQQALHESYDELRAQQQRATHRQKRNYDSKAVARAFPIGCWTLRYYPPARKNKLCSPWIGPYKIVRAPMEWVVGIQTDADAHIFYVHMDDLKRCATPDPEPSWPDAARGTSIVVSTRAPSTLTRSEIVNSQHTTSSAHQHPTSSAHQTHPSGAHHTLSVSTMDTDVRASDIDDQSDNILVKNDTVPDTLVITDTAPDMIVKTDTAPTST